jgi:hypothetical protein
MPCCRMPTKEIQSVSDQPLSGRSPYSAMPWSKRLWVGGTMVQVGSACRAASRRRKDSRLPGVAKASPTSVRTHAVVRIASVRFLERGSPPVSGPRHRGAGAQGSSTCPRIPRSLFGRPMDVMVVILRPVRRSPVDGADNILEAFRQRFRLHGFDADLSDIWKIESPRRNDSTL